MSASTWIAVLHVVVLAGGGEPSRNDDSHAAHVRDLLVALEAASHPRDEIAVFWADGTDPAPDRVIRRRARFPGDWRIEGTPHDSVSREPVLADTRFPGYRVASARRAELAAHFRRLGARLVAGDTVLLAVTDHGEPDPAGGDDVRITLWGESWSVSQLAADLEPLGAGVRVGLWMSQCYSGGFAAIASMRPNTCGAFSAPADRPAYGCFADLAAWRGVGHFARMTEALVRHGALGPAGDAVRVTDDTPDVPRLTSDMWLDGVLTATAVRRATSMASLIDEGLARASVDAPARRIARAIATRYGLGELATRTSVERAIEHFAAARVAADAARRTWRGRLDDARGRVAEAVPVGLDPRLASARFERATRGGAAPLDALHGTWSGAAGLSARVDRYDAAVRRIGDLYARLAAPYVLGSEDRVTWAELRACEAEPIGLPSVSPIGRTAEVAPFIEPMPASAILDAAIAARRPGDFGWRTRRVPGGVRIAAMAPGGPAERAGLRSGDVVHAIGGVRVADPAVADDLAALIRPGSSARVEYDRDGMRGTAVVTAAAKIERLGTLRVGERLPAIELVPVAGRGPDDWSRPRALVFTSTWCRNCDQAIAAASRWAAARGGDVVAVYGETRNRVEHHISARQSGGGPGATPVSAVIDRDAVAHRLFAVSEVPAVVLIDAGGRFAAQIGVEAAARGAAVAFERPEAKISR